MMFQRDQSDSEATQPVNTWRSVRGLDGIIYPSLKDSNGDTFGIESHIVTPAGFVLPSVVCPYDCGFHEFIQLKDWSDITDAKQ